MGKKSRAFKAFWVELLHRAKNLLNLSDHIDAEEASAIIRSNVSFEGPNVFILFCAIIVASLGLNVNSIPVIIGAMLISPLMGPITGLGLAIGTNDLDLLRRSVRNLAVMVFISLLASTLYFILSPLDMEHPTELLARTNPTIYDVLIAFFGGFAGILETSRKDKGVTVLAGVAIATALMPPLCTVGYGIAYLNLQYITGALYLFFINSVFIALATWLGVKYMQFPVLHSSDPKIEKRRTRVATAVFIIIIIPSILSAITIVRENNFNRRVSRFITENKTIGKTYIYDYKVNQSESPATIDIYLAGEQFSTDSREQLFQDAEQRGILRSQLIFHEEAVSNFTPFSEEELIKDILATHEAQLKERDNKISELEGQLNKYTSEAYPTLQISKEIHTQYPQIIGITIAKGENAVNESGKISNQTIVILQYQGKQHLQESELKKLKEWLQIRLETNDLVVI